MNFTKTLVAAAVIAFAGTTVSAGGLAGTIDQPPIEIEPTSSVPAGYIVLGLLAALVAASGSF